MLIEDFREQVLFEPLRQGLNNLLVVAGYGSSITALQHLTGGSESKFPAIPSGGSLRLVLGMYARDGISTAEHDLFRELVARHNNFDCRYIQSSIPVHSKCYVWSDDASPQLAFIGSANYSKSATSATTRELMTQVDPLELMNYSEAIYASAIPCSAVTTLKVRSDAPSPQEVEIKKGIPAGILERCPCVGLPLTVRGQGLEVPTRSGLNWGQRPEEHREPNQAYLSVPSEINASGFFPARGEYFRLLTDDGETFIVSRRQDNGKALHTPDNSELGIYFRDRLRIERGSMVTITDLRRYGRIDVSVYYIGDDTYYMDFHV